MIQRKSEICLGLNTKKTYIISKKFTTFSL